MAKILFELIWIFIKSAVKAVAKVLVKKYLTKTKKPPLRLNSVISRVASQATLSVVQ